MAKKKIKFTKGELKRQRDTLAQFKRYLPTLILKQQQLQLEVRKTEAILKKCIAAIELIKKQIHSWVGLLSLPDIDLSAWVRPLNLVTSSLNIAGVNIPVFEKIDFADLDYDLFIMPLWIDPGIETIRKLAGLIAQKDIIQKQYDLLDRELKITMQRVNLFEKIKIPESEENIRVIRIYLGDQQTNAVGRSKIAKKKIEKLLKDKAA